MPEGDLFNVIYLVPRICLGPFEYLVYTEKIYT